MAISTEGKLAILVGLLGLGGPGALTVAPEHTEIGWGMIGIAALGGVMLGVHHFRGLWKPQHKARMIALTGMIIFGLGFIGSAAVYFWPSASRAPDSTAVAQLAELGWGVQPQKDNIRFELSSKPLPEMRRSAELFRKLGVHFSIQLGSLPSLSGLHYLSDIDFLDSLSISAGTFTDISEIRDFRYLKELYITQTPIDGRSAVDSSPLVNLINLRKLNLGATKILKLPPLEALTKFQDLYLRDTWVSDLSPLSSLPELQSLDITDIRGGDLTPISHSTELVELGVGSGQIPGLLRVSHLPRLTKLRIISQNDIDLSPVGALPDLEYLWIWAGVSRFDVGPLRNLTKLQDLTIQFMPMGRLVPVDNISALAELSELHRLTLGELQLTDLSFVSKLDNLSEINLSQLPISSLESLRGLKQLKTITISTMPIVDISPLLDLPELTELRIMQTPARADQLAVLERRGVKVQSY